MTHSHVSMLPSHTQGGGAMWILNQGWEGRGPAKGPKKKVTPAILILMVSYATLDGSDNDNEEPKDLTRPILPSIPASQSDATLKGDLEEAISAESWCEPILSVLINAINQCWQDKLPINLSNGKFVSKPAVLCWKLHQANHASTDCLCWVQEVSCFNLWWQWLGWTMFMGWKSGSRTCEVWRTKSFLCSLTS